MELELKYKQVQKYLENLNENGYQVSQLKDNKNNVSIKPIETEIDQQYNEIKEEELKYQLLLEYLQNNSENSQNNKNLLDFKEKLSNNLQGQAVDQFINWMSDHFLEVNQNDLNSDNKYQKQFETIIIDFKKYFDQNAKKILDSAIEFEFLQENQSNLTELLKEIEYLKQEEKVLNQQFIQENLNKAQNSQEKDVLCKEIIDKLIIMQQNELKIEQFQLKELHFQQKNLDNFALQRQEQELLLKKKLYDINQVKALNIIDQEFQRQLYLGEQDKEFLTKLREKMVMDPKFLSHQEIDFIEIVKEIIEIETQIQKGEETLKFVKEQYSQLQKQ